MAVESPLPVGKNEISPRFRRFSGWVSRIGALRITVLTAGFASLASLALTWLCLRLMGYDSMGNALWISMLVPLPLALAFGGVNFYLVVALEQACCKVNELAMVDSLTGLSNRRRFLPAAEREIDLARRHHQPLALLVLDVDHFKAINDAHGHVAGDQVLIEVGRRCQQALRSSDLLARWGGEEFIVLLPNTPVAQALQLAERVRETVSASAQLMVQGQTVQVTVSVGAAGISPGQAMSLDALIQLADSALYLAKHAGRDRVSMYGHFTTTRSEPPAARQHAVLET